MCGAVPVALGTKATQGLLALRESLRMRGKTGHSCTVGAALAALSLARLEHILELTKLPGQPSSKFVNWKHRMSFTSLLFLIHVSRQLDSAVASGLDFT